MRDLLHRQFPGGAPTVAQVSASSPETIGVIGETQHQGVPVFSPKGVVALPSEGDNALLLSADGTQVCVGVLQGAKDIVPGELLLYSSGGATIHLKKDGSISLNGLIIDTNGTIQTT